ncbi:MAG TPA: alpha/beta hydrolase [Solirubrobacteraceae bacterium]|nr:alpha/beta hydrolase [Solirubrobacteraceae bacterium]
MALVDVGDIHLDCERSGSGPPLLLIMGMSGTALTWGEPFLRELRRDFEVIVYDHRGVGASSRLEGPITTAELAADAAALLAALELDSVHVLGISMGGMVAQELALAHPERVRTLALGCTYCGGPRSVRTGEEQRRRIVQAQSAGDRELALRTSWELNVSSSFASDEQQYSEFAARALRRRVAVAVILQQARAVLAHDTSARLSQLSAPTLILHGTEDQLLPLANAQLMAELVPHARVEIFDGVGHLFFLERPQRSAALLREHAAVHA